MQPTGFKNASGLSFSSTPEARPGAEPPPISAPPSEHPIFEKPSPKDGHYPEELRSLIDEATFVRRRIQINRSFGYWLACWDWILGALILAAAFSHHLGGAMILGGIFIFIGAGASFVLAKRKGPSFYGAACQLDASAGLQDRLSTTIHLAAAEDPNWMVLHQRRDALARLKRVNARTLFPLQMPAMARRTAAIALVALGFFAYRTKYGPPVVALVQKTAQTHLVQAVISPLVSLMENGPLNLLDRQQKQDVLDAEAEAAGTPNQDDKVNPIPPVGLPNGENLNDASQQNSPGLFPTDPKSNQHAAQPQNQTQSNGSSSLDSQQQNQEKSVTDQNSPKGANDSKTPSSNQGQSSAPGSNGGQQSLGQKLIQALKDMMGNMTGQDANQSPSQQSPDTQGPSAQGQGGQSTESPAKGGQQGALNNDPAKNTPEKSGQHSGAGNGTQPLSAKQPGQDAAQQNSSNLVPERVPLDASDFRVQTRPRAMAGPGTAEVPLTNASAPGSATTNGAEQENIPMRYRQYVQRYFDQGQK